MTASNDDTEDKGQPDDAKKKKKKLLMVIGFIALLVFISVGATFFILSKMMGPKHSADETSAESSSSASVVAPAIYYPLTPNFTVNYNVNGRQRFLQTEITLMYRDPALLKTLELHMPAVRNGLVMLLGSQMYEDLQTLEGKEKLRAAALQTVQNIIAKENAASAEKSKEKSENNTPLANIEQVLYTQFVMQ